MRMFLTDTSMIALLHTNYFCIQKVDKNLTLHLAGLLEISKYYTVVLSISWFAAERRRKYQNANVLIYNSTHSQTDLV